MTRSGPPSPKPPSVEFSTLFSGFPMYYYIFRLSDESIWDIIQGDDREEAVKAVMDPAIHLGMKDQENM